MSLMLILITFLAIKHKLAKAMLNVMVCPGIGVLGEGRWGGREGEGCAWGGGVGWGQVLIYILKIQLNSHKGMMGNEASAVNR